jgi:hypothetical protein
VSFLKNAFSDYVALRNMEAMYKLQYQMAMLTLIITIATVVMLFAYWDNINNVMYQFFLYFLVK